MKLVLFSFLILSLSIYSLAQYYQHPNMALVSAIAHQDMLGIKKAILAGADPNLPGNPPLKFAIETHNKELFKFLLDHGATLRHCIWSFPEAADLWRVLNSEKKLKSLREAYSSFEQAKDISQAKTSE